MERLSRAAAPAAAGDIPLQRERAPEHPLRGGDADRHAAARPVRCGCGGAVRRVGAAAAHAGAAALVQRLAARLLGQHPQAASARLLVRAQRLAHALGCARCAQPAGDRLDGPRLAAQRGAAPYRARPVRVARLQDTAVARRYARRPRDRTDRPRGGQRLQPIPRAHAGPPLRRTWPCGRSMRGRHARSAALPRRLRPRWQPRRGRVRQNRVRRAVLR
mmetsp:Transcript_39577/g.97822  ORF Transcript_39577/g.97822 Transcript_39577/m.97822 type:complete len:218 (-) Transcript_39577:1545-2198(-)